MGLKYEYEYDYDPKFSGCPIISFHPPFVYPSICKLELKYEHGFCAEEYEDSYGSYDDGNDFGDTYCEDGYWDFDNGLIYEDQFEAEFESLAI